MKLLFSLIIIGSAALVGLIFEKFVITSLKKFAVKTSWRTDDIIINAIKGMGILCCILVGIYFAIQYSNLSDKFVKVANRIFVIIFISIATVIISKIAVGFVTLQSQKISSALPSTSIFVNLTRIIIFILGFLVILQTLGISITPILTALGVGGLAVALALQDTLSNLFSGLHILISRQVRPGDYIKLDNGEEGYVVDITWRNTTIKKLPNNLVIIPNSKLASAVIVNFHLPDKELAVLVDLGVSYDSDLEKVEKITIEVAKEVMKEVPGGVPEFEPFIRYHTFSDFSINFTVIMRAKEYVDQYLIKHEFIKRLHKRYKQEGIVIPYPIRTVYMKNE
ncbi:MAG: mechanosensitive ion channel family protein [Elusimicrobiota bacterium]|nr:mechanosensitive ion channel family protein [Endomicrobiia bacterium]MDW8056620.1 mechanosensitive ion channel family protein [Elusimicrobiota bacterium]